MRTIWKATLTVADKQTIEIPDNSVFRHVHAQNDVICVWYECDSDAPMADVTIYMTGTGHDMGNANISRYLGSAHLLNGKLVYHVFEGNERWERGAP